MSECTHDERPSVVFAVLVLKEDVDDGGHEGIQEGEDRDGDEELCRGRIVSDEEHALPHYALAHGCFKGHLVQPDTHRGRDYFDRICFTQGRPSN